MALEQRAFALIKCVRQWDALQVGHPLSRGRMVLELFYLLATVERVQIQDVVSGATNQPRAGPISAGHP